MIPLTTVFIHRVNRAFVMKEIGDEVELVPTGKLRNALKLETGATRVLHHIWHGSQQTEARRRSGLQLHSFADNSLASMPQETDQARE